ncbi:MAG: hypothetical protein PHP97_00280 [Candidatus Shapirobacteria bacterium]|nr:hypothetical protein [Candidatus Shapirobacteria bacterium]MDD3002461.1 hypothetical protein [Candidatus Shapirobacteria bacterium]MDD4383350.1 hypothetical protein [Candidatus Shapirobacteria bacterium]
MAKITKLLISIIIEVSFLGLLFIILPTIFIWERPGVFQTSFEKILPLDINHSYTQSFISDRNNLNSVSVLLKNPGLESRDIVYIEIQNNNQETLRSFSISGRSIEDPGWLNFKFPPLNSKKGDIFLLKISSNSQKDNLLYIYGDPNTQNINFKTTFTAKNIKESFKDNLNKQINNFKSRNIFYSVIFLLLLLLTNIFILI